MSSLRLETELKPGGLWFVIVASGSKKKGTYQRATVSDAVYTLAQAQCFCSNNRAKDYEWRLQALAKSMPGAWLA